MTEHGPTLQIELDLEEDGRWMAEIPALPGVLVSGASREEAIARVEPLALRVLAERVESGERMPFGRCILTSIREAST